MRFISGPVNNRTTTNNRGRESSSETPNSIQVAINVQVTFMTCVGNYILVIFVYKETPVFFVKQNV